MAIGLPTLLLVDDEFATLEVLELLLEPEGYRVLTASNGDEALELLGSDHVDLVITDYKMPKMDGVELCERMRLDDRWREIPVILTSATFAQRSWPPQVVGFVRKPLLFATLLALVRKTLDSERGEPSA
ncbi:MAG TPA: response regulator [Polyangiaceae bacterium]|jgi:CheY-like chemotaxis protein|nr:response regulator [Polyangiaceae bacterium]